MNALQIHRIHQSFSCFSCVPDDNWHAADIIHIHPATPHSIREAPILYHAMFIVKGGIRVFKISPSTNREITLYRVLSGQCCVLMMASILGETEYEASISIETDTEF